MFMSRLDLINLTGYQKPSAQKRWLAAQGIPFLAGGDGLLKVLQSTVVERLGGQQDNTSKRKPQLRLERTLGEAIAPGVT